MPPSISWRKSSFSEDVGGACVEVAFWRKSSFSEDASGACVEVALAEAGAAVRDSKNTEPQLRLPGDSWRQLVEHCRSVAVG